MYFQATEDWTDAKHGCNIIFQTTPNGSTAVASRWQIGQDGGFYPLASGAYDIGAPLLPLRSGFFSGLLSVNSVGVSNPAVMDAGTALQLTRNGAARAELIGFTGPGTVVGRRANGTPAAPSKVLASNSLFTMGAGGYGATGWAGGIRAAIVLEAAEDWTDAAQGADILFQTTPVGAIAPANRWKITDGGHFQPLLSNTYDIGSRALGGPRTGYFGTGLWVDQTNVGPAPIDAGTMFLGTAVPNAVARMELNAFGQITAVVGKVANGAANAPGPIGANHTMLSLEGRGCFAPGQYSSQRAQIALYASEAWGAAAQGAEIAFATTLNGSVVTSPRWVITNDGHLIPGANATYELGRNTLGVRDLWLTRNIMFGAPDAGHIMLRPNATLLDLVLGDQSTFGDIRSRLVATVPLTVATLPAAPVAGSRAFVTDANSAVFNAAVAGGGANKVPVIFDGAAWHIG